MCIRDSSNTAIVTGTGEHIFNLTQNYFTSTIVDMTMDIKSEQYINVTRSDTKMFSVNHYAVSYTHLRAHETVLDLVCRLLLDKKNIKKTKKKQQHVLDPDDKQICQYRINVRTHR